MILTVNSSVGGDAARQNLTFRKDIDFVAQVAHLKWKKELTTPGKTWEGINWSFFHSMWALNFWFNDLSCVPVSQQLIRTRLSTGSIAKNLSSSLMSYHLIHFKSFESKNNGTIAPGDQVSTHTDFLMPDALIDEHFSKQKFQKFLQEVEFNISWKTFPAKDLVSPVDSHTS